VGKWAVVLGPQQPGDVSAQADRPQGLERAFVQQVGATGAASASKESLGHEPLDTPGDDVSLSALPRSLDGADRASRRDRVGEHLGRDK
jgi:hypothetical protein